VKAVLIWGVEFKTSLKGGGATGYKSYT
jgi:hypothetical protein